MSTLMTMLVRAQTAHGDTIVEFLDDVMQNRIDGFRPHHRIAAAKELALHIVRDETPAPTAPGRGACPREGGGSREDRNPSRSHLSPPHPSFPRRREPIPSTPSTLHPSFQSKAGTRSRSH